MEASDPAAELKWTGERLVTSCHRPIVYEHLHRYAVACAMAEGKRVLDIACGEGYGANLLAQTAAQVVGVDRDAETVRHAAAKYRGRNVRFCEGSCTEIPCADGTIDLVASFETIEHIAEHDRFLEELKRVLVPDGLVVISSPDKAQYRKGSNGANSFHEVELAHDEFVALLQAKFRHCIAGRQRLVVGSWMAPDAPSEKVATATFQGGFSAIEMEPGLRNGVYSIAVCSDAPLPVFALGLFEDPELSAQTWDLLDTNETLAGVDIAGGSEAAVVARLKTELQLAEEQTERVMHQFREARWEALTARTNLLREPHPGGAALAHALELQNRAEVAESEREQLREMTQKLQIELEATSADLRGEREHLQEMKQRLEATKQGLEAAKEGLEATTRSVDALHEKTRGFQAESDAVKAELRAIQRTVRNLQQNWLHKMVRPFSSAHRKIDRLEMSTPGG